MPIPECVYCGVRHVPLQIWEKGSSTITVCQKRRCEDRAERAGFRPCGPLEYSASGKKR
jgi:hypothetical protein